jgi:hypothetical protein
MGKKLTVDLWTDKLYKIKDMREYLKSFKLDLDVAIEETVDELVELGARRASLLNTVAPKSGVEDNQVIGDSRHGTISLVGRNAIYDEFGTGEEGAYNPHPMKNDFSGLNPYNSGPFVSSHIDYNGWHYWYYRPMAGSQFVDETGKTHGIPSGKQMYNTLLYVREIEKDVTKKHVNEAIKSINK